MNKKTELIKNTLILGIGVTLTRLASFILLPLYTIYLTSSEYGFFDLIVSYVIYLVPIMTLQLEWAAFRFLIDARQDERKKKMIITNVFQMVLMITVACVILFWLLSNFVRIPYFELTLILMISVIISSVSLQFARGLGDNKKFAIASIFTGATTLITFLVFVPLMGWGLEGALLPMALANLVCTAYLFFALRLYRYISMRNRDIELQKKLIGYSLPLIPEGVSWWVVNVSDRSIITIIIGVAANGIYAVANRYAAIFNVVFSVFAMSWNESVSMHIDDEDKDSFFSKTSNAIVRLLGSLGLVMIAILPLIFNLLIDEQYSEAYMFIPILIVAAFLHAIAGLYSSVYTAKKLTKQIAKTTIIAAIVNITTNLALIYYIGIYAAAISTVIAYLVLAIYRHYDIKKYVTIDYDNNIFVYFGLLYAIVTAIYYLNNPLGNIASAIAVTSLAIFFNKSIVLLLKNKLLNRRALAPEQQVLDEKQF